MIIASLLCSYPISSWLTTFSQRIYNFPSSPSFLQSGKMLIITPKLIPNQILSAKQNSSRNFNYPRNLGKAYHVPMDHRHSHINTPADFPVKPGPALPFLCHKEVESFPSGLETPGNKPTTLQSPSTTTEAGGSIRFCNFRPSS